MDWILPIGACLGSFGLGFLLARDCGKVHVGIREQELEILRRDLARMTGERDSWKESWSTRSSELAIVETARDAFKADNKKLRGIIERTQQNLEAELEQLP